MDFILIVLIMLSISLFFTMRFKVNSATGPLLSIALIVITMLAFAFMNLIVVGGYVVTAFALFSIIYVFALKKYPIKDILSNFLTPATVFFIAACIYFFIVLESKNAAFKVWDEFSFWGIAAKAIKTNDMLYSMFESSMVNISYLPALPIWSYFNLFFNNNFVEWRVYLAYDILMMASMTVLFSRVKWKNIVPFVVFSVFSVVGIYAFLESFEGLPLFASSYSDVPIGFVFGGVLLAWFANEKTENKTARYLVSIALFVLLALIKDMGLALGFVAAGIMAVDMVISSDYPFKDPKTKLYKILKNIATVFAPFVAIFATYRIWSLHISSTVSLNIAPEPYEYSIVEILTGKDPYFLEILNKMWDHLFAHKLIAFGTVIVMIAVFTIAPLICAALTANKKRAIRVSVFSFLLLGGFAAYYLFHAYLYTAVFQHTQFYDLSSYGRYMSSYCIGWMIAAVGAFTVPMGQAFFKKFNLAFACVVMSLSLYTTVTMNTRLFSDYYISSKTVDVTIDGVRNLIRNYSIEYRDYFEKDDRFYLVCQESDGGEWFVFNYEFMPSYTVKTMAGGNFVNSLEDEMTYPYAIYATPETFSDYLREQNVDFVFVLKSNQAFLDGFSQMFEDNLAYYYDGSGHIYAVIDEGGKEVWFKPISNVKQLEEYKKEYQD